MPKKGSVGVETKSFASVLKSNHPNPSVSQDPSPAIVLDDSCLSDNDLSCATFGKIKDINALPNLYVILNNEGFDNVKLMYLGGYWVLIKSNSLASKEKLIKHAGVSFWFSELGHANNLFVSDVRLVWTAIDGLPMCAWNKEAIAKIVSPWGALAAVDTVDDDSLPYRKVCVTTKVSTIINDRIKIIVKGKIYWIRIRELEAWSPEFDEEFCDTSSVEESMGEEKNSPILEEELDHVSESSFVKENNDAELNEKVHVQKAHSADPFEIYNLLNKKVTREATQDDDPSHPLGFTPKDDDAKSCPSVGFSGGILCVWDPNCFVRNNATISDSFVAVCGTWIPPSTKIMIVSVYAPQDLSEKNSLWFGTIFNESGANAFNHFISTAGLIDLPLEGYSYTWAIKSASKMSKLDSIFKKLFAEQIVDLECDVTYDEIKRAVWDCGTNKSPGPDGFTFDFILTFWKIINQDVVNAVREFFITTDFEKAFNYVRWNYLDDILINFGFGPKWRMWIQGCLSSAIGSILVNGSPTSEFEFHKGLKQGDPLSPYLFILVMESLHLSFTNILNACLFKGIRIDDTLTLSHLFYADDAIFIGKWERANVITIVRMLNCFFMASGLQINIHKSKLMGIGISIEEVNAAANIIGCSTFSTPFTYLGVKVGMSSFRKKSWDEVIGKISAHLSKWKIKTLSIGVRLMLIKSVLTSLPLYHMSLYKAPLGVLHDLESFRRKFFNGIDENERKISMIDFFPEVHLFGTGSSLLCMANVYPLIAQVMELIPFFDTPLSRIFPRLAPRGGAKEDQFIQLVDLVDSITISNSSDRWVWLLESSGGFSVHSARTYIDDLILPTVGSPTRWVKVVPIKINIFAWKFYLDKLPTRLNLSLRGIDIPSIICPNCGLAGESCSQLFFSCSLARLLWSKVARWWDFDILDFSAYEEWITWFKTIRLPKVVKEFLEVVFYVMWWLIWKFRNQVLFGISHPRMDLLFDEIVLLSFTWCSNRCKHNIDWISWMKYPRSLSL
nr:RNA-directed DNA polymerase, eukaryota [Tanacetum cinerariifolium]